MGRDIDRYYDELGRELLLKAQDLYRESRYDEALQILETIDRAAPNRPDVVAFRKLCHDRRGTKLFAEVGPKDKERVHVDLSTNVWQRDVLSENNSPDAAGNILAPQEADRTPIRGKENSSTLGYWEPGQFDQAEAPALAMEYADPRPNWVYLLGAAAFFIFYVAYVVRPLVGGPQPGDVREFAGIDFVWIPRATLADRPTAGADRPARAGAIGGFWMSRRELTAADYARVVDSTPGGPADPDLPMTGLDPDAWLESYLDRLNRIGKGAFRLPSSAEWLYASRAGSAGRFAFGDDPSQLRGYAWYEDNAGGVLHAAGENKTTGWGLFDVHGNAAEWAWVEDDSVFDRPADRSESAVRWVLQGGSAVDPAESCAFTAWPQQAAGAQLRFAGVRLVREPGPSSKRALKVVEFPADASIGILFSANRRVGPARGRMTVRENESLTLALNRDGLANAGAFSALRPDDLHGLNLSGLPATDATLDSVRRLTGLRALDLSGAQITDRGLDQLARFDRLEELRLSRTSLSGWGFDVLARLPNLIELALDENPNVTDDVLSFIGDCPQLQRVSLVGTATTDQGRKQLQRDLPQCWIQPEPPMAAPLEALAWARMDRYSLLYHQIRSDSDYRRFGYVSDQGWHEIDAYSGASGLRPGFWVYVRPYWYVWGQTGMHPLLLQRLRQRATDSSPLHAVGEPDSGDVVPLRAAWSPHPLDDAPWLSVEFDQPVHADSLHVYTKTDSLSIRRVDVFTLEGDEVTVWSGPDGVELHQEGPAFAGLVPMRPETGQSVAVGEIFRVRLHVAPSSTRTWLSDPQIDAVQLVQAGGINQWAGGAYASSVYDAKPQSDAESAPVGSATQGPLNDPASVGLRGVYGRLRELLETAAEP